MRQIILDTETTGLDISKGHRIIEIGCVELLNRTLTGKTFHVYLNPDRNSDSEALAVHGLTTEFLSQKPRFLDIYQEFTSFIQNAEIIAHNANFDTKFLDSEFKKIGQKPLMQYCTKIIDSLAYARSLNPGKRNSLDALCERYQISKQHRILHGALLDAELLAQVWLSMTRGQETLKIDFVANGLSDFKTNEISKISNNVALKIIYATSEELKEHKLYLQSIKENFGQVLWNQE